MVKNTLNHTIDRTFCRAIHGDPTGRLSVVGAEVLAVLELVKSAAIRAARLAAFGQP
jgi:hypothetical protein